MKAIICLHEMIRVHHSKPFPSLVCCKCLNFITNTSVLELLLVFTSASEVANFRFLLEPIYVDGGPAETGAKGPGA